MLTSERCPPKTNQNVQVAWSRMPSQRPQKFSKAPLKQGKRFTSFRISDVVTGGRKTLKDVWHTASTNFGVHTNTPESSDSVAKESAEQEARVLPEDEGELQGGEQETIEGEVQGGEEETISNDANSIPKVNNTIVSKRLMW